MTFLKKPSVSLTEIIISSLGALIGISLIAKISIGFTDFEGAMMLIPSMGAAAVLVFAMPQGKLSQPWPLIGGNIISAFMGVSCYLFIPSVFIAAGAAVGLSIMAMHITHSLHPPGGATALVAVIGGDSIHALGYQYIFTPILLNVLIIFAVTVIFSNLFHWRRYPSSFNRFSNKSKHSSQQQIQLIDKSNIEEVIVEMDLVIDTSINDLQYLVARTLEKMQPDTYQTLDLQVGQFYCNGHVGRNRSVREILSEAPSNNAQFDMVMYRVVEGKERNNIDSCTTNEFRQWAAQQVFNHH